MRILCVHQGFELYGSDRCFLDTVATLRHAFPHASIKVLLPRKGPLLAAFAALNVDARIAPLWVARRRGLLRLLAHGPVTFPVALARALADFRDNDLVLINTVAVLDYLIAAAFFRNRALLHVHEAPQGVVGLGFGALVRGVRAPTIFNSFSTKAAYDPGANQPAYVVYNAVRGPAAAKPLDDYDDRRLRLLMIGRLSPAKGQDLLLEACRLLPGSRLGQLDVKIVGDAFDGQRGFEARLRAQARNLGASASIEFAPFAEDPSSLYDWCDVVVAPSRVREGFGRVPVEAMAHGRAAIVADHGGLAETVAHEQTGWRFRPGDARDLSETINHVARSREQVRAFGAAARRAYENRFAPGPIEAELRDIVRQRLNSRAAEEMSWFTKTPRPNP